MQPVKINNATYQSKYIKLQDGKHTTIHTAIYPSNIFHPIIVSFTKPTLLLDYCKINNYKYAINGGFFDTESQRPLGKVKPEFGESDYTKFGKKWGMRRSMFAVGAKDKKVTISKNVDIEGSYLLQAGPRLINNSKVVIKDGCDTEGFSAESNIFDNDITSGRYPRSAIAVGNESIYTFVCDGSSVENSGMTLEELARYIDEYKVNDAMNLDGGVV